jgi:hypothetical protein
MYSKGGVIGKRVFDAKGYNSRGTLLITESMFTCPAEWN